MLFKKINNDLLVDRLLYAFLGAALIFFMAQISIPLDPVPITLQTVAVMLIGLTFERRAAIGAVLTYLTLGAMGFPVFSDFSGGPALLFGPRGGYLIGFLPAVILMAMIQEKGVRNHFLGEALACLAGTAVIFLCGVSWLSTFLGLEKAILAGFVPFIIPGFLKIGVLIGLMRALRGTTLSSK